jgi:hypothetical protein
MVLQAPTCTLTNRLTEGVTITSGAVNFKRKSGENLKYD